MKCRRLPHHACRPFALVALAGFTLISVPQEIEIGREENAQVRKQIKQLRDPQVTAYITRTCAA